MKDTQITLEGLTIFNKQLKTIERHKNIKWKEQLVEKHERRHNMKKFEKFVKDGAFIERENGNVPYAEIIYRLKSYEDTNLLPKEIEQLKRENDELKTISRAS